MPSAGKVAPTYGGSWAIDVQYEIHTFVRHNDNCYVSKKPSFGEEPLPTEDSEFWFLALKNAGASSEEELKEKVEAIVNGTTPAGDSKKLNGKEASCYAEILLFENMEISTDTWVEDTTYTDSGFVLKADITCEGVTEKHFVDVTLSVSDAVSGNYAPVASTGDGRITVYAKEIPTDAITIPSIKCVKGGDIE